MPIPSPHPLPAQPLRAALKSLALPGLGQWHNGQVNKAVWCFLAFAFVSVPAVAIVALWLPPVWTAPALALGVLAALALWLGSALDAWRVARRVERLQADAGPAVPPPPAGLPVWRMGGVTLLLLVLCDFIALPLLVDVVRSHHVQAFRIPSGSMAPTLWPGDFVFADRRYACIGCAQPVRRGDVVVLAYPNDRTTLYVKRVVALPGDRVQSDGAVLRVNGAPVPEADGPSPPGGPGAAVLPATLPPAAAHAAASDFVVPPGQVFALGDQRARSVDSRHFGTVPLQDVVGRVRQVWFSWGEGGVRWSRLGRVVQ